MAHGKETRERGEASTFGRARLTFADTDEIDEFVSTLERYERGEISADQWRQFRLVRGTYGQRQATDAQMLRVKIPQGVLTAAQLDGLAEVAEQWSRGFGHITTRQNVQFHFVKLHDIELAMRRLAEAGLTTREACGSAVRTITACPYAGVAANEAFDVTPYAEALTRHLLRHPLSSHLPRKFKIAFEGCPGDHIGLAINDIGFHARLGSGGTRGFRVVVGGGTSTLTTTAGVLHEFLPASDILQLTEAVLGVFQKLGDYEHKQRNRMKFLIRALGWDRWHAAYLAERESLAQGANPPILDIHPPADEPAVAGERRPSPSVGHITSRLRAAESRIKGPGLTPQVTPVFHVDEDSHLAWRRTNTRAQRQEGYATAVVTVPLGDLTGEQLRVLGELASAYGDGTVRMTTSQNLLFRWVRDVDLRQLYRRLAATGLGLGDAHRISDTTSCPGAETCRLAVTHSRGLAQALTAHLQHRPELVDTAGDATIKISGCPNGCGQHHIATIGLQGSVRRIGGRAVPHYFVMVGGGLDATGAHFARLAANVPARRVPKATERLIDFFRTERQPGESATAFFARVDLARVRELLTPLATLAPVDATPDDYVDLGTSDAFVPEVLEGECIA